MILGRAVCLLSLWQKGCPLAQVGDQKGDVGIPVGTFGCRRWFGIVKDSCLHCWFQSTREKYFCWVRAGQLFLCS